MLLNDYEATAIVQRTLSLIAQLFSWITVPNHKENVILGGKYLRRELGILVRSLVMKYSQQAKTNSALLNRITDTLKLIIICDDKSRQRAHEWIQICLDAIIEDSLFPKTVV
jgi:hypothetical protein